MSRGTHLSEREKGAIDALHKEGVTIARIAKAVGRSPKAIRNYLRPREASSRAKRRGRPRKLSARDRRHIFKLACKQGMSARKILTTLGLECSKSTIDSSTMWTICAAKFFTHGVKSSRHAYKLLLVTCPSECRWCCSPMVRKSSAKLACANCANWG
ncbi:TPA: hypothetical protein N0F65_010268 [Lagenidium giganteum]|uniref:Tc3 transposase DNA binding domain-containing protein n=1 Tax=Lagenidium giganteum TaxID=4803 RepID=A0AAV2YQN6_9STRA|nr:TPA: hypothetical protein N0F65_010268 [Lagenidium giganteum]